MRRSIKHSFFLLGAHIGHFYTDSAHLMSNFVLGISHSFFVLNLEKSVLFYKKALIAASIAFSNNGRFLFSYSEISSLNLSIKSLFINIISRSKQSFVYLKWIPGCVSNFRYIFTRFIVYFMPELTRNIRRFYLQWSHKFNRKKRRNISIFRKTTPSTTSIVYTMQRKKNKILRYMKAFKFLIRWSQKNSKKVSMRKFLKSWQSVVLYPFRKRRRKFPWSTPFFQQHKQLREKYKTRTFWPLLHLFFPLKRTKKYIRRQIKIEKKKQKNALKKEPFSVDLAFRLLLQLTAKQNKRETKRIRNRSWVRSRSRKLLRGYTKRLLKVLTSLFRKHSSKISLHNMPVAMQKKLLLALLKRRSYRSHIAKKNGVLVKNKKWRVCKRYAHVNVVHDKVGFSHSSFWFVQSKTAYKRNAIHHKLRKLRRQIKSDAELYDGFFSRPWHTNYYRLPRFLQKRPFLQIYMPFATNRSQYNLFISKVKRKYVPPFILKRSLRKIKRHEFALRRSYISRKKRLLKRYLLFTTCKKINLHTLKKLSLFLKHIKRLRLKNCKFNHFVKKRIFLPKSNFFFFEGVQRWVFIKNSKILPTFFFSQYSVFKKHYDALLFSHETTQTKDLFFFSIFNKYNFSFFSDYMYYILLNQKYLLWFLRNSFFFYKKSKITLFSLQKKNTNNVTFLKKNAYLFHLFFILQFLKLFKASKLTLSVFCKYSILILPILLLHFFTSRKLQISSSINYITSNTSINKHLLRVLFSSNILYFHFFFIARSLFGSIFKLLKTNNKLLLRLFNYNTFYTKFETKQLSSYTKLFNLISANKKKKYGKKKNYTRTRILKKLSKMNIKFIRRRKKAILPKFKWLFLRAITVTNTLLYNYEFNPIRDKNNIYFSKYFKKVLVLWKAIIFFRFFRRSFNVPDCLFLMNPSLLTSQPSEFYKLHLPIFGIVDSNSNLDHITYPIPSNDDSVILLLFFVILFTNQCVDMHLRCKLKLLNFGK